MALRMMVDVSFSNYICVSSDLRPFSLFHVLLKNWSLIIIILLIIYCKIIVETTVKTLGCALIRSSDTIVMTS